MLYNILYNNNKKKIYKIKNQKKIIKIIKIIPTLSGL